MKLNLLTDMLYTGQMQTVEKKTCLGIALYPQDFSTDFHKLSPIQIGSAVHLACRWLILSSYFSLNWAET